MYFRRVLPVDTHHAVSLAGVYPDARQIAMRARGESADYKENYGSPVPTKVLAERYVAL